MRLTIPTPALFLAAGLLLSWPPPADAVHYEHVSHVGTVALAIILFHGGFEGGWSRTRRGLGPIAVLGLAGTLVTAVVLSAGAHLLLGLDTDTALLVGVALSPTDPAAVFSVLSGNRMRGRGDLILEGESGANDPVGIALMLGAIEYVRSDGSTGAIALDIVLQLCIGLLVGVALGWLVRRLLAWHGLGGGWRGAMLAVGSALVVFAVADVLHGSGFLAAFVAGLVVGDGDMSDVRPQASAVLGRGALLSEAVMFGILGVTAIAGNLVDELPTALAVFALLTFVIRPAVVWLSMLPFHRDRATMAFVAWGGLKGAVPILLATFPLLDDVHGAAEVHAIVFVAVATSILVQGSTLGLLAHRLRLLDDG